MGVVGATALSVLVLTWRQYRPWRHVSDRRRAVGFGLGVVATALLVFIYPRFIASGQPGRGRPRFCKRAGAWSLLSLGCFWFLSLFHLAIRMRLHFLRLRPKLGVAAILIGFVPLVLMVVLGLMILYTGLGGARAAATTGHPGELAGRRPTRGRFRRRSVRHHLHLARARAELAENLTLIARPGLGPAAGRKNAGVRWLMPRAWTRPIRIRRRPAGDRRRRHHRPGSWPAGRIWLMRWRGAGHRSARGPGLAPGRTSLEDPVGTSEGGHRHLAHEFFAGR